ncbi:radical SAM protein [uncultured Treponema sp.]|uniref:radical SAM protein n=1 Tax=uncultured Treponema sp. TaxID=162155 RepID=UPI0025CCCE5F|nr:radical SAM protein [uncultured Treponema sp.]
MFSPEEIIFATTTACNLHCPHCFVNREPFHLNAEDAVTFLKSTHESADANIEKIGFSGGEPFLNIDFLEKVIKSSIEYDFMFDRIMTNGDWWKSEEGLRTTFQKIYDAGYDGKIGLSYDSFHAQNEERIAKFIQIAWDFFGNDAVEIQSVNNEGASLPPGVQASLSPTPPSPGEHSSTRAPSPRKTVQELLLSLSQKLNLTYEEQISKSRRGIVTLSDEEHFLPAYIQTESYQSTDPRAFKDAKWFKDDFCEGPGQILFVHATGDIAPCCGFANENKELFIGKITDDFDTVLKNAAKNKMIKICYEEGLSKQVKLLKEQGKLPDGKTNDICTFCDLVCKIAVSSEQ